MSAFKKGQAVRYRTPRGRTGSGKIVDINKTVKGEWFKVKDGDAHVTVRASGLTAF